MLSVVYGRSSSWKASGGPSDYRYRVLSNGQVNASTKYSVNDGLGGIIASSSRSAGFIMMRYSTPYANPGPYTSMQRSSKALTISLETCPKNADETDACIGLANA